MASRFRGAVFRERLEPVLNELVNGATNDVVKSGELISIALINAAGDKLAEKPANRSICRKSNWCRWASDGAGIRSRWPIPWKARASHRKARPILRCCCRRPDLPIHPRIFAAAVFRGACGRMAARILEPTDPLEPINRDSARHPAAPISARARKTWVPGADLGGIDRLIPVPWTPETVRVSVLGTRPRIQRGRVSFTDQNRNCTGWFWRFPRMLSRRPACMIFGCGPSSSSLRASPRWAWAWPGATWPKRRNSDSPRARQ